MFRFFANKTYFNFYFMIEKCKNIQNLSRMSGMTRSHLTRVTDQLVRENLIIKNQVGREAELELTKKGKEFKELLNSWIKLELNKQEEK